MVIVLEPGVTEVKVSFYRGEGSPESVSRDMDAMLGQTTLEGILGTGFAGHDVEAIAFRIPFGMDLFGTCERVDAGFLAAFRKLVDDYPVHIPHTLRLLEVFLACAPRIPQYAFFETGFFSGLPDSQRYYALPAGYCGNGRVRKWGYHGIFHEAASRIAGTRSRVLSVVLDRQTTVAAVRAGRPLLISLGQTPLEGVMGRTVCGDLDPGIVFFLMKHTGKSLYAVDSMLKEESGFLGMTGYELTMQELVTFYGKDKKVDLAFAVYQNQIMKYMGEGIAAMGGVDAVVFSGAYLDSFRRIVYSLLKKISFLGVTLRSVSSPEDGEVFPVTAEDSPVTVYMNRKPVSRFIYEVVSTVKGGEHHVKKHDTDAGGAGDDSVAGLQPAGGGES